MQNGIMNKRILAVITARGGSKGVPRKNIKKLGRKPLIVYTINVAKGSRLISNLIVSTDDREIADVAKKNGADTPFIRPAELAGDTVGHVDVMKHAVGFMEERLGIFFDYVVILQPTSPFRLVEDIDETLRVLMESDADSGVSMTELDGDHPVKVKKMEGNQVLPYCLPESEGVRRQDLPKAYKRSSAVYAVKRNVLMEQGMIFGNSTVGYVVPTERSIDIDTEYDWLRAEYMLKKLQSKGLFL